MEMEMETEMEMEMEGVQAREGGGGGGVFEVILTGERRCDRALDGFWVGKQFERNDG